MPRIKQSPGKTKWQRSERYLNREFSWLQFNRRVLEEAANPKNPLLERLRFLAIFESNLDEFYMVRVSGLIEQVASGVSELTPDGLTPEEQLQMIAEVALPLRREAAQVWHKDLLPNLAKSSIKLHSYADLDAEQRAELRERFANEIFPLLTPLILTPAPTVPFISNRSLNIAVELHDAASGPKLARVKVPTVVPRLVRINKRKHEYILIEDLIRNNLRSLFPGVHIAGSHYFRVIRDADIEIRELDAADLVDMIEETIRRRRFGDPVLLEVNPTMPKEIRRTLMQLLELDTEDVFTTEGLIGFDVLHEIANIDRPNLKFPIHIPYSHENLSNPHSLLKTIDQTDILLHHPFDSFKSVESFVDAAATDPKVIGIKQTLYRVGKESPIVERLLDVAEEGKQVAALVELKARFDESNNLGWARQLERAGVHVTYGFSEMKTHCKLCLIVRRDQESNHAYAHIGTGNYNPTTARIYSDIGLFTRDPEITQDIAELFNFLTGFSKQTKYRKLLVAPLNLREGIIDRIRRETRLAQKSGKGRIIFKLNSLVDPEVIDALYEANATGVEIDLIVRGICCLRPQISGLSDRIRVRSIVGRFLEHSRIYYFENGGRPESLIGSADLMRRNLDRRIEVLVPVERPEFVDHIRFHVLESYLKDNTNAWVSLSDGTYRRIEPKAGAKSFTAQDFLMANPTTKVLFSYELPGN